MRILVAISLLLPLIGCEDEPETAPPVPSPTTGEADPSGRTRTDGSPTGGVAWEIPAPFQSEPPASSMRAAEYLFPEEEGERAGVMTVFFFGPAGAEAPFTELVESFRPE